MFGRMKFIMKRPLCLAAALIASSVLFWHGPARAEARLFGDNASDAPAPAPPRFVDPRPAELIADRAAAALGFEETPAEAAPPARVVAAAPECPNGPDAFGVTRVVELDPSEGRHYGAGRQGYESTRAFLGPKEVVLTFDDGPNPRATPDILATLREFCVQATFFVVGRAARAHPDILADIAADGHTIAGHTLTHPMPFARRSLDEAADEIERGYQAVEGALGEPIAAIFRFPGLSDSPALLDYLSDRGLMSLSIDVDSGDTRRDATTQKVIANTLAGVERRGGGVVLFHDPLQRTSRALPTILRELRRRGYRIVHLVSATDYAPPGAEPRLAAHQPSGGFEAITTATVAPSAAPQVEWPRPSYREIEPPLIGAVY